MAINQEYREIYQKEIIEKSKGIIFSYSPMSDIYKYLPFSHNVGENAVEDLATIMRRNLPFYCYGEEEVVNRYKAGQFGKMEDMIKFSFKQRLPDRSNINDGLLSETLLDLLIQIYTPNAYKMAVRTLFRQNDRNEIKGYDLTYFTKDDTGISLWLGQAKLGEKTYCKSDIDNDLNTKFVQTYLSKQMFFICDKQIVGIYLRYVSPDDLHVYSVDECFIDATDYLKMYHKTEKEFANMLRDAVFAETGICATAGIGTNLFLAKVALDIVAKHVPDHIGVLDEESFKEQIWYHRPITDIWNVGPGIARELEHFGVYDLHGVTLLPKDTLWRTFGVNARFLLDHANGVEPCTIAEIKAYQPKSTSISNGQVLFRDYSFAEAELILMEMVELMTLELIRRRQRTSSIGLTVGYSKEAAPMVGRTLKLPSPTQSYKRLSDVFRTIYAGSVQQDLPIRRLNISLGGLCEEADTQLSLFDDSIAEAKERSVLQTIVKLHDKYGKNSIVRGRDFEECATLRARNGMIGGHRSQ